MSPQSSDSALLAAYAREGDEAALAALIQRHWPHAYRIALRSLRDPAAAEDAAQEAMVALMRGARRYDVDRPFLPWFRTLVLNAVRMAGRSRTRRVRHARKASRGPDQAARPDDESEDSDHDVAGHVAALPHDVRSAVVLHYFERLSHTQVAATLGCPKGTVASRLRRGLQMLRTSLGAAGLILAVTALEEALAAAAEVAPPVPAAPSVALLRARSLRTSRGLLLPPKAFVLGLAALAVVTVSLSQWWPSPEREIATRRGVDDVRAAAAGPGADALADPAAADVAGGGAPVADPPGGTSRSLGSEALGSPGPAPATSTAGSLRIIDPAGHPVAGAWVVALDDADFAAQLRMFRVGVDEVDGRRVLRDRLLDALGQETPAPYFSALSRHRARSDVNGFATTTGWTGGRHEVLVLARGFADLMAEVHLGEDPPVVRLAPSASIDGRIVDTNGSPVADMLVFAFPAGEAVEHVRRLLRASDSPPLDDQGIRAFLRREPASLTELFRAGAALTGADGRFTISGLRPGTAVDVQVGQFFRRFDVLPGKRGQDIVMPAVGAAVRLRTIAKETGAAVNAEVRIFRGGREVSATRRRRLPGDVTQLTTTIEGDVELDVIAPGRLPVRFPLLLEAGERIELGDVALAQGGGGVQFVVEQPAKKRVVRFSVVYRDPATGGTYRRVLEVTDSDEAVLDGVSPGAVVVTARDFELDLRVAGSNHPIYHRVGPVRVEVVSRNGQLIPVPLDLRQRNLPR